MKVELWVDDLKATILLKTDTNFIGISHVALKACTNALYVLSKYDRTV